MALIPDVASRISFQAHDFFTPQTISASAYIFRYIFHDWSDKYVVQIIRQLVPVLKPGTHIVLFDAVLPPDNEESTKSTPLSVRKMQGAFDIQMLTMFNSKERTAEDWASVFKLADSRFQVNVIKLVPGSSVGLIDMVFDGSGIKN